MKKGSSRAEYNFPKELRKERLEGTNYTCEGCGKKTEDLQVHHLIACYLASRNDALAPSIIKTIENEMCLCHVCHLAADADQKKWTAHDVAMIAWALFDIEPEEVEKKQRGTYLDKSIQQYVRKKKVAEKRRKRRR